MQGDGFAARSQRMNHAGRAPAQESPMKTRNNRSTRLGAALACAGLVSMAMLAAPAALASSHREAPMIAGLPRVDNSDLYAFRSYEPGRDGYVVILANFIPV